MGGYKRTVHARCCRWLVISAAFTAKATSWPKAQASGNGVRRPLVALWRSTETDYKQNWTELFELFLSKYLETCLLSTLVFTYFKCLHFSRSSILELVGGAYNQVVVPSITRHLHAPGCYDNRFDVSEILWALMACQTPCWIGFNVFLQVVMMIFTCLM